MLTDLGLVAFGLAFDELFQSEHFHQGLYPYHLGMQFAYGNVFGDGSGEKLDVLGHGADALAQAPVVYFGDVMLADEDMSSLNGVDMLQQ